MADKVYTLWFERADGSIEQHGFHLGTILDVAQPLATQLAIQSLRANRAVSVALRRGNRNLRIWDWRDLEVA